MQQGQRKCNHLGEKNCTGLLLSHPWRKSNASCTIPGRKQSLYLMSPAEMSESYHGTRASTSGFRQPTNRLQSTIPRSGILHGIIHANCRGIFPQCLLFFLPSILTSLKEGDDQRSLAIALTLSSLQSLNLRSFLFINILYLKATESRSQCYLNKLRQTRLHEHA